MSELIKIGDTVNVEHCDGSHWKGKITKISTGRNGIDYSSPIAHITSPTCKQIEHITNIIHRGGQLWVDYNYP